MKKINEKLLELITTPEFKAVQGEQNSNAELFDVICEGERHDKLVKFAGALSRHGLSENALIEALLNLNETLCDNPLPEKEVVQIAKSIFKYGNYKNNPDLDTKDTKSKILKLIYQSKGNADERYQTISNLVIDDLSTKGDFIKTSGNDCYFFSYDEKILISLNPENINYKKLMFQYRINPKMKVYNFLHQSLLIHTFNEDNVADVYKFAHYNIVANKLYIKCSLSQMYIVDSKGINLCENGTDGVLFSDIIDSEPFEYVKNESGKDYITDKIISLCNFNPTALDVDTQRTLAKTYFLSLFMPEFLSTKPILTVIGSKGSGKTTLLKAFVKTLYGKKHNVCSVPSKGDDLDVMVINSHFLPLDNWDNHKAEFNDKIAVYSTGGYMKKRKLYSDGTVFQAFLDAFIGISTRSLNLRRDDLLQRLILLEVNPISGGYIAETELMKPVEDCRNELLSQAIDEVQKIIKLIEDKTYNNLKSSFRMADFAKFLTLSLDSAEEAEEYLTEMSEYQKTVSTENDVLLEYLCAFVTQYHEKYYSAQEIYTLIVNFEKDEEKAYIKTNFEKNYENVFSFAKRLNNIKNDIKEYLIIDTRKGRGNQTEYRIQKGEKYDELRAPNILKILDKKITNKIL